MIERYIVTQQDFDEFCHSLTTESMIAIDTEFMRVRTLNPQFALLQLASKTSIAIVDPLTITDWSRFIDILNNKSIKKLFHAAGEDLVLFWSFLKCSPSPYIDTQVLLAFMEEGASLGLASALLKYLDITIDKTETRTDWLLRPLSSSQIAYAYDDVRYLIQLYETLLVRIQPNHLSLALEECQYLALKPQIPKVPMNLYQSFPMVEKLNRRQLGLLQILANWRYNEAVRKDLALNFIVHEKNLVAIAQYEPTAIYELQKLGLHPNEIRVHGALLLEMVQHYKENQPEELPNLVPSLHTNPRYKSDFASIKFALETIAAEIGISAQLIASRKQINQLLIEFYLINEGSEGMVNRVDLNELQKPIDLLFNWRKSLCLTSLQSLGFVR